jgi:hypothetical protein
MSPSELARLTGVSTDTLRHYERKGVLGIPARGQGGYRLYPPEAVGRVRLVRRALAMVIVRLTNPSGANHSFPRLVRPTHKRSPSMHESKDNLPLLLDAPGATLRSVRCGEMTVNYAKCDAGTDFTPVLKGLKDDMCQCPHWGYVLRGALNLRYTDGREETVRAGEVWYAAPGHTAWCDEDTEYIDVNPPQEFAHVIDHVRKQMQG